MPFDRRAFLSYFAAAGLGHTLLPGVLFARATDAAARRDSGGDSDAPPELTEAMIADAEAIAGLEFTPEERRMMIADLKDQLGQLAAVRAVSLPNDVAPAMHFNPLAPGATVPGGGRRGGGVRRRSRAAGSLPPVSSNLEELAFLSAAELGALVRARKVSSVALTEMYLGRLKSYGPRLQCVVTLTEERALRQARAADADLKAGRIRGPLHGVPWGAKDLLAVAGYPSTWGTVLYETQTIDADAEVVRRLDAAGAVLVAKLTLGELAYGDVWFGGTTRNPWNTSQGSSGSSAGPASATAAGLVGFSIGSETLGSISSPSTRCGVTGLRPTFGRVPRTGAMALSWSMDKLGPICRSVEDCALVLDAIRGADGRDLTTVDAPFDLDLASPVRSLRVGYLKAAFDRERTTKRFDDASLDAIRALGVTLSPVVLPDLPYDAMTLILSAEAAASFDRVTRLNTDDRMARQTPDAWPNTFRSARFIPAVEYLNANRLRTQAIEQWRTLFANLDVIVAPTGGSSQLTATNLTGHPAVILPNGFRPTSASDSRRVPVSLTFLGDLYGEAKLCQLAGAYQRTTNFHLEHPVL